MPSRAALAAGAATLALGFGMVITGATASTTADLAARAKTIASSAGGTVGFSATCGDPPRTVSANEGTQLRGASTLKVGIALAAAIAQAETGAQMQSDGVLSSAIIESDNSAANALFERAGSGSSSAGVQATNALFSSLGMANTRFDGPYIDTAARSQKVTTAGDVRLLAEALLQLADDGSGPLARLGATKAQGQALIALMRRASYPSVFAGAGATAIAHKPGWLDDAQNDLAIITLKSGDTCAVGFVSEGLSLEQAQAVGSKLVTQVVEPLAVASRPRGTVSTATNETTATTGSTGTTDTTGTVATTATAEAASTTATTQTAPAAGGTSVSPSSEDSPSWYADWRVWALCALALLVVLILLRQRQMARRRRERALRRRG